jgi:radical SAM protein with 4Fe4S-binding SPASM domain
VSEPLIIEVAEIEVNTACPRRCSYCPNSIAELRGSDRHMSRDLFSKTIAELAAADFVGRLSFHLYSEPLLRKDLHELVATARRALPRTFLVLLTNGDLLTESRYQQLLDSGIDRFLVTRHDDKPMPERPFQDVQHWTDMTLTSRSGVVVRQSGPLRRPCYAPSEMLIVTFDGDVLLCHEDGKRQAAIGNLASSSLRDIWFASDAVRRRRLLQEGNREAVGGICARCDLTYYAIAGNAI